MAKQWKWREEHDKWVKDLDQRNLGVCKEGPEAQEKIRTKSSNLLQVGSSQFTLKIQSTPLKLTF